MPPGSHDLRAAAARSSSAPLAGAAHDPAAPARACTGAGALAGPGDEWILVAGASEARLFRRGAAAGLVALQTFHEVHDHARDRPTGTGGRRVGESSPQRRRQLRFAATLAAHLENGLTEGRCRSICLLAACPFMGALRKSLPLPVRRAVRVMMLADLCEAGEQRILDALAGAPRTDGLP